MDFEPTNHNPVIRIGNRDVYVEATNLSHPYNLIELAQVTAVDQFANNLTNSVVIDEKKIDYANPGIYKAALSVIDKHGYISIDYLKIHVLSASDVKRIERGKKPLENNAGKTDKLADKSKPKGGHHLFPLKKRQPKPKPQKTVRNPTAEKKGGKNGQKKSHKNLWITLIVILIILILGGTFFYIHSVNHPQANESFHEVQVNDSLKKYNDEANILIDDLGSAVSNYKLNGNKKMYLKAVGEVQANNYDLQSSLAYRKKHGRGYLTLENKLQKLSNTAQAMQTSKNYKQAEKQYKDAYGGVNKIAMTIDNLVISH
ncbi:hypothetical protein [Limosilactobacillus allomucosae]|uniref:hypothetical protein n=1 Tax=Limosilactobacillus allomucosae TaxID=3142938 RepID=UPI003266BF1F